MNKERRKYQRKPLIFFGRAFERQTGQFLGTVADITVIGLMVISDREMEIGKTKTGYGACSVGSR